MDDHEGAEYTPEERATFNVWIEIGAADPEKRRFVELSPMRRFIIAVPSSSPEAEALIHEPLEVLLEREIPGVRPDSKVTSTIVHHERGLRKRIIRAAVSVEQSSGDVSIEYDKQL